MNTNEFLQFAQEYTNQYLSGWKVELDRAVRRAGCCKYATRTLSFSKFYIENNSQDSIMNTLIHEIAHGLTPNDAGHGREWELKCKELGLSNPSRCYDSKEVSMPDYKYKAICAKCGEFGGGKHRLPQMTGYKHKPCGGSPITWRITR